MVGFEIQQGLWNTSLSLCAIQWWFAVFSQGNPEGRCIDEEWSFETFPEDFWEDGEEVSRRKPTKSHYFWEDVQKSQWNHRWDSIPLLVGTLSRNAHACGFKGIPETFSGWELRKIGGRRSGEVRMEVVFRCETNWIFLLEKFAKRWWWDDDGVIQVPQPPRKKGVQLEDLVIEDSIRIQIWRSKESYIGLGKGEKMGGGKWI